MFPIEYAIFIYDVTFSVVFFIFLFDILFKTIVFILCTNHSFLSFPPLSSPTSPHPTPYPFLRENEASFGKQQSLSHHLWQDHDPPPCI